MLLDAAAEQSKGSTSTGSSVARRRRAWQRHWQHTRTKFAAEEQQKLEGKVVENQAEDEVGSHVDEANKVQMVKKWQMRRCSIRQTSKRP